MDYSLGIDLRVWRIISYSLMLLLFFPVAHAIFVGRERKERVLKIISSYVLTALLVVFLKYSLRVPRPSSNFLYLNDYSFPSMHSSLAFLSSAYLSPLFYGWSFLIAYSRLALGVHRVIDVVVGMFIGISMQWVITRYWQTFWKNIRKENTQRECFRQFLHLLMSIFIFLLAFIFPKPIAFLLLTLFLSLVMFFHNVRVMRSTCSKVFPLNILKSVCEYVRRDKEKEILLGPISLLFGSLISVGLFPYDVYLPALLVVGISDAIATAIGVCIGNHTLPFNKNKTLEGTTAGSVVTFIIFAFYSSYLEWYKPLFMALLFTIMEMIPFNKKHELMDDNVILPVVFSLVWWFMSRL